MSQIPQSVVKPGMKSENDEGFCEIFQTTPDPDNPAGLLSSDEYQQEMRIDEEPELELPVDLRSMDFLSKEYRDQKQYEKAAIRQRQIKEDEEHKNIVIEDDFDIIDDVGDQKALISYYNDTPAEQDKVQLKDKLKQQITNLGYMFTTNGSKKVDLGGKEEQ